MGAFADFEKALLKKRQRDEIALAKYVDSAQDISNHFPILKFDDFLDVVLIEAAVPLGKHGAMMLLSSAPDCSILVKSANLPS
jgi:hypothetical protein